MLVNIPEDYWNIYIPNPEFKYIFTIDLGGRIIVDNSFKEVREKSPPDHKVEGPSYRYLVKRKYEKKEGDINFSEITDEVYHMLNMEESTVKYYVDPYLLQHSTPLRWFLNKKIASRLIPTTTLSSLTY